MNLSSLFDAHGRRVFLSNRLAGGGEGDVFSVNGDATSVAKIYNNDHKPDAHKQQKIQSMIRAANPDIFSCVAWPKNTLHESFGGRVAGFLMPIVENHSPIHSLYSPRDRLSNPALKQQSWHFLLATARNVSGVFAKIHRLGHVMGDVNPNNVLFANNGLVTLIDADSFQFDFLGSRYFCEVGMPDFTPPELHGVNFKITPRTANQDCFGLAVLIFQLLMGGRSPFAGNNLIDETVDELHLNARRFRYAYASDAQARGIKAPKTALPIELLPQQLRGMFHAAFTESGVQRRPTAAEWHSALGVACQELAPCPLFSSHVFSRHLHACPWCQVPKEREIFMNIAKSFASSGTASFFDLDKTWRTISSVSPPKVLAGAYPLSYPPAIPRVSLQFQRKSLMSSITGLFNGKREFRQRCTTRIMAAQNALASAEVSFKKAGSTESFDQYLNYLSQLKTRHETNAFQQSKALRDLVLSARDRQLMLHLGRFSIVDAKISGIGPAKISTLIAHGATTAADMDDKRLKSLPGFGPKRIGAIIQWRKEKERLFVFSSAQSVSAAEKASALAPLEAAKRQIEAELLIGAHKLSQISQTIDGEVRKHWPAVQENLKIIAQERANLQAIG